MTSCQAHRTRGTSQCPLLFLQPKSSVVEPQSIADLALRETPPASVAFTISPDVLLYCCQANKLASRIGGTTNMTASLPLEPEKVQMTLTVHSQAQACELEAAWREIVTGEELPRSATLENDLEAIQERARIGLEVIERAIREHPTTDQAGRLVRFLAAIYNGYDFSFDLTELRALDTELANACVDYLNYDRLSKREVHHHLSGGDRELQRWIDDYRVEPRLTLDDRRAEAFAELMEQTHRHPNELVREAVDLLLDKHQRRKASEPKR